MKTKHIFSTFALAALAMACSNETFEVANEATDLNGRIPLGDIQLVMPGDATTRFDIGTDFNTLSFVAGDRVGACLIDIPYDYKESGVLNYKLTDYISSNYAFAYGSSGWTTPAKMVEGNYMFYAPYNDSYSTRKPVVAKLKAVQQLEKKADGTIDELSTIKELIKSNEVVQVGHEFLSKDGPTVVAVKMRSIYAYPLITVVNGFKKGTKDAADLVISQVVIQPSSNFVVEAPFNFDAGKTAVASTDGVVGQLKTFEYTKDDFTMEAGAFFPKSGKNPAGYTKDLLNTSSSDAKKSAAIIVKAPEGGITLSKDGGEVKFHAVIPADSYSGGLDIFIYTNKGVFKTTAKDAGKLDIAAGRRYPLNEYKDGQVINNPEGGAKKAGDTFKLEIGDNPESSINNIVATTSDLVQLIKDADATKALSVNPLNDEIEVNEAVMDAIKDKNNSSYQVTFIKPVTITTSISTSTDKKINFAGAIIKSGTITLAAAANFTDNLTIESGATVTIDGSTATKIVNEGTLTVKSGTVTQLDNEEDATATLETNVATVNNSGKVVLLTKKTFTFTEFTNDGTLEVQKEAKATIDENNGTIDNSGEITVTENTEDGVINNSGKATVPANSGLIDIKDAAATVICMDVDNIGRINNSKDADVTFAMPTKQVIYYEFTSDVTGKLVPRAGVCNAILLKGITWAPDNTYATSANALGFNVIMENATIAAYEEVTVMIPNLKIIGTCYAKGLASNKIIVKAAIDDTADKAELKVSNIKVYHEAGNDYDTLTSEY